MVLYFYTQASMLRLIMTAIATHHITTVQNLRTHYVVMGNGQTPVVFLHGWGGNTDSFFKLGLALVEARPDLKLIIVDYPGFGLTDAPDSNGWTTHQYADWVKAFCDELKIKKTHFYVHSFGGRILTRLINAHPELGDKLIFTGAAGVKWPLGLRQKISVLLSKIMPKAKSARGQKLQKFIVTKIFGARDWGNVKPTLKTTLKKVLAEDDLREDLTNIKQPSLIMWGEQDTITPLKSGKVYAAKIPNNKFVTFKTGRHGIHHTHRSEIVEALAEFL